MYEEKWSAEYRVRDGERPAWLEPKAPIQFFGGANIWLSSYGENCSVAWYAIDAIRVPAAHWAAPAINAGLEPWPGGDTPPADFKPGGRMMLRNGLESAGRPSPPGNDWTWLPSDHDGDIIGYERAETPLAELQRLGQEFEAADSSRECRPVSDGFVADVSRYKEAEIESVDELLRLINGGAKISKIRRKSETPADRYAAKLGRALTPDEVEAIKWMKDNNA